MDRDKRWDRVEVAWKMLTRGEGKLVDDLAAAVEAGYTATPPVTDEFVDAAAEARPRRQTAVDREGRGRLLLLQLPRPIGRGS